MDSIGCALEALDHPACTKLLGPVVPGLTVEHGARVPGTAFYLDPVTAAFNIGAMLRWTDFSDTYVAVTTMHPSDDVGAILALADYLGRSRRSPGNPRVTVCSTPSPSRYSTGGSRPTITKTQRQQTRGSSACGCACS